MTVRLLPSTEKLVVAGLTASSDVTTLATGGIGTVLYAGTQPRVWLTEVAGSERVRRHLTAVSVDVRCYGGTKSDADLLRLTVHDVLVQMSGGFDEGVITDVRCISFPTWNPDEAFTPPWPRYLGTYEVAAHPNLS